MRVFNSIFGPDWMHVLMHTALFCGLVLLLLVGFGLKPGGRAFSAAMLAILAVAVLQEGLQALGQGIFFLRGTLFDLGVDLLGGAIGYGIYTSFSLMKREMPKRNPDKRSVPIRSVLVFPLI